MDAAELSALLMLATATSFTPGPNTTLSTALAANRGLRGAMHFVLAVPVGWGLLLSVCALGAGTLVQTWPALRLAVVFTGVVYLLWLAWRLWRSQSMAQARPSQLDVRFIQGVLLQFLNIKAWMLGLSVVAGWVAGRPDALSRYLQVMPLMLAFAFLSNFSYALLGSLLRQWLSQGRRLSCFNRAMATTLVVTAGWIAHAGMASATTTTM